MCSVKLAKSLHKKFSGDFEIGVKMKHIYPGGYPIIRIWALRPFLGLWRSNSSFRPEQGKFDTFYKSVPPSKGVSDRN